MRSAETAEARIMTLDEKVANAKKELCEAKARASKTEKEFREQKECADALSKKVVHWVIKLGEMGSNMVSMHQRMNDTRHGETQGISDAKTKIIELKKSFQAEIRDLNAEVDSRIQ